jgi:hypothetical protein
MPAMSNDQKKTDAATVIVPPFLPDQHVIVGPYTSEEVTTYEIAPLKITINRTLRASHANMGNEAGQSQGLPAPADPVTAFMDHLAKHPEVLPAVLEKLQDIKSSDID